MTDYSEINPPPVTGPGDYGLPSQPKAGARNKPRHYGFHKQLSMSQGVSDSEDVRALLLRVIPGACQVIQAHEANDRNGTDYWVEHERGRFLSIDCKIREEDWSAKPPPLTADDLALEIWSVVERRIVGWTRDRKKQTDYVLWFWLDTRRWCLIPFLQLCGVFEENWELWQSNYKHPQQYTPDGDYHSECVFVPRHEVWASIITKFGGTPA